MTKTEDTEILQGIKIWHGDATAKDVYVDFKGTFKVINYGKVILRISCDSNYVVKINGMKLRRDRHLEIMQRIFRKYFRGSRLALRG